MNKLKIMIFILLSIVSFSFANNMQIIWYPKAINNINNKDVIKKEKAICIYDGKVITQLEKKINNSEKTKDEIYKEVLPEGYYEIIVQSKDDKKIYKIINSKNMIYEDDYYLISFLSDIRDILLEFITEKYISGEFSLTPTNCDLYD